MNINFARAVLASAIVVCGCAASSAEERNWSGVYLGGNIGWANTTYSSELQGFPGNLVTGEQDTGIAGVHLGYQHQFQKLVVGVEVSLSTTQLFDKYSDRIAGGTPSCLGTNVAGPLFSCEAGMQNLVTLGPRLGWAIDSNWLVYGTGGWARATVNDRVTLNSTGGISGSTSERHDGWFVGGGVEYAFQGNWSVGIEYLHVDLNKVFHCELPSLGGCAAGESRSATADSDIVRARISFKLYDPTRN